MTYKPGQSGNLAGRPKGSGGRTRVLRDALHQDGPELLARAIQIAKNGDHEMLKFLIGRLVATPRSESEVMRVQLPAEAGLAERAETVVEQAA